MNATTNAPAVKSTRKAKKPAEPVHGTCRWIILPIAVKDFESGVLAINETEYVVTLPEDRSGARLTKPDGEQYTVDLARCSCDCPDSQYRPRPGGCKHFRAVKAAVATLPARQKSSSCPACQEKTDGGQMCTACETEANEYYDAVDQMHAMEAAGLDPFGNENDGAGFTMNVDDALLGDAWESPVSPDF